MGERWTRIYCATHMSCILRQPENTQDQILVIFAIFSFLCFFHRLDALPNINPTVGMSTTQSARSVMSIFWPHCNNRMGRSIEGSFSWITGYYAPFRFRVCFVLYNCNQLSSEDVEGGFHLRALVEDVNRYNWKYFPLRRGIVGGTGESFREGRAGNSFGIWFYVSMSVRWVYLVS